MIPCLLGSCWKTRRFAALAFLCTSSLFYAHHELELSFPNAISHVVSATGSSKCSILPTTDSRFELELCYLTDACNVGSITIVAPLDDCSPQHVLTSKNATEDAWTYQHLGPHTFHLQLYGATRAAQEPAPFLGPDKCAWRFDFDAKAAGRLGFQVHHVYDGYKGFMNVAGPPPLTQWKPLVDSPAGFPVPLDPVAPSHREHVYVPDADMCPETSLLNKHVRGVVRPPMFAVPLLKHWRTPEQVAAKEHAPLCSRHDPVPGVFRNVHPSDSRKSMVAYKGYVWEPEPNCRMDELPYQDTEPKDIVEKLSVDKRKILFLGDSHDRYAFYFIRSWYQQNWTYLLDPYRLKEEHSSWGRGQMRIEFSWDRFMEQAMPETYDCDRVNREYGTYDTFVLSSGHHLMITDHGETKEYPKEFSSVEDYVDRVRKTVTTFLRRCPVQSSEFSTRRIIWMTPPAYRPPYVKFRWDDHRTNTRIWQFASRAIAMLRAEFPEVAIIDQFSLMLPFGREAIDGLHAYGTDAAWPIALEVNHKLGLGKRREWWVTEKLGQNDEPQQTYAIGKAKSGETPARWR